MKTKIAKYVSATGVTIGVLTFCWQMIVALNQFQDTQKEQGLRLQYLELNQKKFMDVQNRLDDRLDSLLLKRCA